MKEGVAVCLVVYRTICMQEAAWYVNSKPSAYCSKLAGYIPKYSQKEYMKLRSLKSVWWGTIVHLLGG